TVAPLLPPLSPRRKVGRVVLSFQMDEQDFPGSQQPPGANVPSSQPLQVPRRPLLVVFFNDQGLRSGWRIVLYLLQIFLFSIAFNFVLGRVLHLPKNATPPMWQLMLQEGLSFCIVFLPALLMARLESRPSGAYGLPARVMFGAHFWHGAAL